MLLGAARIALDKVSSRVDTFGLLGHSPHVGEWAAAGRDHPLNLRTLERLGKQFRAYCNVVFVVENPQVYEALLDRIERAALPHPPTIVCTHGWFNVAGEVLLEGSRLRVEKLPGNVGDEVELSEVLMLGGDKVTIGKPLVKGAKVTAEVVAQARDKKVIIFKIRRRKRYRRHD